MRLNNILSLKERLAVPGGKGTVTVTGNLHGFPVTVNVKLETQQFDRDEDGAWTGYVSAVLGDEEGIIERNEPVELYLNKDSGQYTVVGIESGWKLTSGAVKPQRPIDNQKQVNLKF